MFRRWRKNKMVADILNDPSLRFSLLEINRLTPHNPHQAETQANQVLNYARSEDYAVYADSLWKTAIHYIRQLSKEGLRQEDVNFYRGSLAATLDALRISHEAYQYLERQRERSTPAKAEVVSRPPLGANNGRLV